MFSSSTVRTLTLLLLNDTFFSPFLAKESYVKDAILRSLLGESRSFCLVLIVQILFLLGASLQEDAWPDACL